MELNVLFYVYSGSTVLIEKLFKISNLFIDWHSSTLTEIQNVDKITFKKE